METRLIYFTATIILHLANVNGQPIASSLTAPINCNQKSFYCVDENSFLICYANNNGDKETVDEVIQTCPPNTYCHSNGSLACDSSDPPIITTPASASSLEPSLLPTGTVPDSSLQSETLSSTILAQPYITGKTTTVVSTSERPIIPFPELPLNLVSESASLAPVNPSPIQATNKPNEATAVPNELITLHSTNSQSLPNDLTGVVPNTYPIEIVSSPVEGSSTGEPLTNIPSSPSTLGEAMGHNIDTNAAANDSTIALPEFFQTESTSSSSSYTITPSTISQASNANSIPLTTPDTPAAHSSEPSSVVIEQSTISHPAILSTVIQTTGSGLEENIVSSAATAESTQGHLIESSPAESISTAPVTLTSNQNSASSLDQLASTAMETSVASSVGTNLPTVTPSSEFIPEAPTSSVSPFNSTGTTQLDQSMDYETNSILSSTPPVPSVTPTESSYNSESSTTLVESTSPHSSDSSSVWLTSGASSASSTNQADQSTFDDSTASKGEEYSSSSTVSGIAITTYSTGPNSVQTSSAQPIGSSSNSVGQSTVAESTVPIDEEYVSLNTASVMPTTAHSSDSPSVKPSSDLPISSSTNPADQSTLDQSIDEETAASSSASDIPTLSHSSDSATVGSTLPPLSSNSADQSAVSEDQGNSVASTTADQAPSTNSSDSPSVGSSASSSNPTGQHTIGQSPGEDQGNSASSDTTDLPTSTQSSDLSSVGSSSIPSIAASSNPADQSTLNQSAGSENQGNSVSPATDDIPTSTYTSELDSVESSSAPPPATPSNPSIQSTIDQSPGGDHENSVPSDTVDLPTSTLSSEFSSVGTSSLPPIAASSNPADQSTHGQSAGPENQGNSVSSTTDDIPTSTYASELSSVESSSAPPTVTPFNPSIQSTIDQTTGSVGEVSSATQDLPTSTDSSDLSTFSTIEVSSTVGQSTIGQSTNPGGAETVVSSIGLGESTSVHSGDSSSVTPSVSSSDPAGQSTIDKTTGNEGGEIAISSIIPDEPTSIHSSISSTEPCSAPASGSSDPAGQSTIAQSLVPDGEPNTILSTAQSGPTTVHSSDSSTIGPTSIPPIEPSSHPDGQTTLEQTTGPNDDEIVVSSTINGPTSASESSSVESTSVKSTSVDSTSASESASASDSPSFEPSSASSASAQSTNNEGEEIASTPSRIPTVAVSSELSTVETTSWMPILSSNADTPSTITEPTSVDGNLVTFVTADVSTNADSSQTGSAGSTLPPQTVPSSQSSSVSTVADATVPGSETSAVSSATTGVPNPTLSSESSPTGSISEQPGLSSTKPELPQSTNPEEETNSVPSAVSSAPATVTTSESASTGPHSLPPNVAPGESDPAQQTSTPPALPSPALPITPFKCKLPGRYPHPGSCQQFYVCLKIFQSDFYEFLLNCPSGMVFDPVKLSCTVNQRACSAITFSCETEGKFADPMSNQKYYVCVKGVLGDFYQVSINCATGRQYNAVRKQCVKVKGHGGISGAQDQNNDGSRDDNSAEINSNEDGSNETIDSNDIEKEANNSNEYGKKSNENADNKNEDIDLVNEESKEKIKFKCEKVGIFSDPDNERKYFICTLKNVEKNKFKKNHEKCMKGLKFDSDTLKCVQI